MGSAKKLCDWKKSDFEKKIAKLVTIVQDPRFVCKKCGRVANSEEYLCKVHEIPEKE